MITRNEFGTIVVPGYYLFYRGRVFSDFDSLLKHYNYGVEPHDVSLVYLGYESSIDGFLPIQLSEEDLGKNPDIAY